MSDDRLDPVHEHEHDHGQGPVVRDKRRIDPLTGTVRESGTVPAPGGQAPGGPGGPDGPAGPGGTGAPGGAATAGAPDGPVGLPGDAGEAEQRRLAEQRVSELTADVQRVQAEYANYRRRVERDREAVREQALVNVLTNLLPLLDDVGRAREHGELTGGFKSVGEALEATVEKLGLVRFGAVGDPFDPVVHEALVHSYSAEVSETTCVQVFQPGYRIGERVVRPARVAVAEPEVPAPPAAEEPAEEPPAPPAS